MAIPSVWVEMGHHALAWGSTSLYGMEAWLLKQWIRGGGWPKRKRVSRHSHGNNNDRERRSILRATPTPLFIAFF